jgi:prepilin-type processing-associated H-X9-DG protein
MRTLCRVVVRPRPRSKSRVCARLRERRWRGISVVEVLIAITIISMLLTLILPAVQSARSAARRTACSNSLRQVGFAIQNHHAAHDKFPTNGWGFRWVGDPDRGFGREQPGGWIFNTLPYMEQDGIRKTSAGLAAESPAKLDAAARMLQSATIGWNCPERRDAGPFSCNGAYEPYNSRPVSRSPRSDFAANGGDVYCDPRASKPRLTPGPASLKEAASETWQAEFARLTRECNGIVHPGSLVSYKDVTDGSAHTYLVGEKYINPLHYLDGRSEGDERSLFMGANREINRWGYEQPRYDRSDGQGASAWGSSHSTGFNMAFCDGSLRFLRYDIQSDVHRQLSNRRNGNPTDVSEL